MRPLRTLSSITGGHSKDSVQASYRCEGGLFRTLGELGRRIGGAGVKTGLQGTRGI